MASPTGRHTRPEDPLWADCPFCGDAEGARLVVYNHLDEEHDGVDTENVFADPIGQLRH